MFFALFRLPFPLPLARLFTSRLILSKPPSNHSLAFALLHFPHRRIFPLTLHLGRRFPESIPPTDRDNPEMRPQDSRNELSGGGGSVCLQRLETDSQEIQQILCSIPHSVPSSTRLSREAAGKYCAKEVATEKKDKGEEAGKDKKRVLEFKAPVHSRLPSPRTHPPQSKQHSCGRASSLLLRTNYPKRSSLIRVKNWLATRPAPQNKHQWSAIWPRSKGWDFFLSDTYGLRNCLGDCEALGKHKASSSPLPRLAHTPFDRYRVWWLPVSPEVSQPILRNILEIDRIPLSHTLSVLLVKHSFLFF
ncbi:hypothetical protein LSTR_LSTR004353 [Laodelphax striatellus]|uniref:Uncharacterized protein n=1 Tax=Laodelphax striatellus TaxID=195883 RepID=A0A482X8R9_LAOST|nr:hypothetical protein LSTR_LSTR004353 [Laodelphax striatellus]